jgi:hypothetical protein
VTLVTLEVASMLLVMWTVAPVGCVLECQSHSPARHPILPIDGCEPTPYRGTRRRKCTEQLTVPVRTGRNPSS